MSNTPLDYDRVAPTYDARYRVGSPAGIAAALEDLVAGAGTGLEVGCGTGHWLGALARPDLRLVGLDRSRGMLAKARAASAVPLVQADAGFLPFRSAAFDALWCVNALHHFPDPAEFVREAHRALRPGARFLVIGMDPAAGRDRWYLYDWFPGTLDTDRRRYPSAPSIAAWMSAAGFSDVELGIAARITATPRGREVFEDPILSRHGTSQLSLLDDAAFDAGMARIRAAVDAAEARGESPEFPVDIALAMVRATR